MSAAPKVSVVVPVYNPGGHIDDCIRTLLDQSLPAEDYEVVFVDDGSTDGTPARLDALAAEHPNVHVEHIPNSGWPSRPRNVGIDRARGEYVLFVDNDDWLDHEALERLHTRAVDEAADIVIGKVVGHGTGKRVPPVVFRRNRSGVTLREWQGLLWLLTPHKLFRKALLDEHGIRFPEDQRRLEDHMMVVHAYFHAERISVLADHPIYHWMARDGGGNASFVPYDPVEYFGAVRSVLDLIDEHTEPGDLRDRLYVRWYRGKVLQRMGGANLLLHDPEYARRRREGARELVLERFDARLDALLPLAYRVRAHLLREGTFEDLVGFARRERAQSGRFRADRVASRGHAVDVSLEAGYDPSDDLLTVRRDGERLTWVAPPDLAGASAAGFDVTEEVAGAEAAVFLRSARDRADFPVAVEASVDVVPFGRDPARLRPVVRCTAEIAAATAAAGEPLRAGDWQLMCELRIAGFTATGAVLQGRLGAPVVLRADGAGGLRLVRPPVKRRVAARLPAVARLAGRARRRLRGTAFAR